MDERLKIAFSRPIMFERGRMELRAHQFHDPWRDSFQIGGETARRAPARKGARPDGPENTNASQTSEIPKSNPARVDSERRTALKIPSDVAFTEESTFWNPQWGTPIGANETTTIDDMTTTASKVGTGALMSKSSYEAMTGPHLLGFGKKQDNCAPSCGPQTNVYNYGLGIVRSGSGSCRPPPRRLGCD